MDLHQLSIIMAQRLKDERKKRGLSHVALSKELREKYNIEISKDSLINYEVSTENHTKMYKNMGMKIEYLLCLADFYGVSCDYLLGRSDEPHVDATIQSVSRFTGLSGSTIEALHSYPNGSTQQNFIKRFLEDLLSDSNIANRIPEYLKKYAIAQKEAINDRISLVKRQTSKNELPILENGKYVISSQDAADLFLGQAISDAQGEIANIIQQMGEEICKPYRIGPPHGKQINEHIWNIYSEDND